jgi:hypothetical protein
MKCTADFNKLENYILLLQKEHQKSVSEETYRSLVSKKQKYNTLSTCKLKRLFLELGKDIMNWGRKHTKSWHGR